MVSYSHRRKEGVDSYPSRGGIYAKTDTADSARCSTLGVDNVCYPHIDVDTKLEIFTRNILLGLLVDR